MKEKATNIIYGNHSHICIKVHLAAMVIFLEMKLDKSKTRKRCMYNMLLPKPNHNAWTYTNQAIIPLN